MSIEKDEAKATLEEIDDLVRRTRQQLAHGPAGPLLIIWGLIWFVSFLGVHFRPQVVNWLPILGCAIGLVSVWVLCRGSIQTRSARQDGMRIAWASLTLTLYAMLWMFLLHPQRQPSTAVPEIIDVVNRVLAFFATVGMFGYVVAGLWFGRFWILLGLLVTLLTVIGLFAIPQWFLIWMAVVGGGALILSGVSIKRLWMV